MAKICMVGMWHLGCVSAACLSKWHHVACFDPDPKVLEGLRQGRMPIFEPGLEEEMGNAFKAGRLSFSGDLASAVKNADFMYLAFDTPVDDKDSSDISPVMNAIDAIMPFLRANQTIIISSQVPVGTCRKILEKVRKAGIGAGVAYVPENLRLGNAMEVFMNPERIVIGADSKIAEDAVVGLFSGINGKRLAMGLESAEMAKHALNSYLALLISFSGEVSDICERTGADARLVMAALLSEARVSPLAPLAPGLGFGGGTLARDVQSLRAIGKESGAPTPVLDAVIESNNARKKYVENRLAWALGSLPGKSISFFGLTYKPNTDTLRRSLALEIIAGLESSKTRIRAYDPAIKAQIEGRRAVEICRSAEECAKDADAIVITTAWNEFRQLDYKKISSSMRTPVVIDARNVLEPKSLPSCIRYFGVGVGNGR